MEDKNCDEGFFGEFFDTSEIEDNLGNFYKKNSIGFIDDLT